jgi:cytochrome-b5 reductase
LKFKLVKKQQVSHNVVKLHFALPTPQSVLGLPIGQHISCMGFDTDGMEVVRPYTTTTLDSDIGFFELVIKIYKEGKVSAYFGKMKEGEYPSARGPKGCFRYKPNQVQAVGMLGGGTGITPMYQVCCPSYKPAVLHPIKEQSLMCFVHCLLSGLPNFFSLSKISGSCESLFR